MGMGFDFDSGTRRRLGYRLIDQIDAYFSSLPDRHVQLPADQRTFGTLDDALPEMGEDPGKVLDEICREMVDEGFNVPSANYLGLMNPTPTYMGVLAEALVAALNPQLATLARSQLASKIELETVRWIGERGSRRSCRRQETVLRSRDCGDHEFRHGRRSGCNFRNLPPS